MSEAQPRPSRGQVLDRLDRAGILKTAADLSAFGMEALDQVVDEATEMVLSGWPHLRRSEARVLAEQALRPVLRPSVR